MRLTVAICISFLLSEAVLLAANSDCSSLHAVPLCSITKNATDYDGKDVLVTGHYKMLFHGSVLTATGCKDVVNLRLAQNAKADKRAQAIFRSATKKDQFRAVPIVLRGTFHVAQEGQCFGQDCTPFEIEERELVCAEPPEH
jgi:hypothetical protein